MAENPQMTRLQLAKEFVKAVPSIATSPATLYDALVGGIVGGLVPGTAATVQVPFRIRDSVRNRGVADIKRAVREAGNASAVESETVYLDNLRRMAAENPLRERSPEKFERSSPGSLRPTRGARGNPRDGALFQQAVSSRSPGLRGLLAAVRHHLGGVSEAVATGGDVAIPCRSTWPRLRARPWTWPCMTTSDCGPNPDPARACRLAERSGR